MGDGSHEVGVERVSFTPDAYTSKRRKLEGGRFVLVDRCWEMDEARLVASNPQDPSSTVGSDSLFSQC